MAEITDEAFEAAAVALWAAQHRRAATLGDTPSAVEMEYARKGLRAALSTLPDRYKTAPNTMPEDEARKIEANFRDVQAADRYQEGARDMRERAAEVVAQQPYKRWLSTEALAKAIRSLPLPGEE